MGFKFQLSEDAASLEVFHASDPKISKLVKDCKKFTKEQFKKAIEPGDVVVPYKKQKYVDVSTIGAWITAINKKIQGSSFTSCKIVAEDKKHIVGYGVIPGKGNINSCSVDKFLEYHEGCIVLRHKSISASTRKKVVQKMAEHAKKQTQYDNWNLIASVFHHMFGTSNKRKEDKMFNEKEQSALICSSIILKVYKAAGLDVRHQKGIGNRWIWPKEFLTSPSFKVVGGYFSKEAGVK